MGEMAMKYGKSSRTRLPATLFRESYKYTPVETSAKNPVGAGTISSAKLDEDFFGHERLWDFLDRALTSGLNLVLYTDWR